MVGRGQDGAGGGGWVGPVKGDLRENGTLLHLDCAVVTHSSTDGVTQNTHWHSHTTLVNSE